MEMGVAFQADSTKYYLEMGKQSSLVRLENYMEKNEVRAGSERLVNVSRGEHKTKVIATI
jgi:hypothetical protein